MAQAPRGRRSRARARTRSSPSIGPPASSAWPCSRTGSPSGASCAGRALESARWPRRRSRRWRTRFELRVGGRAAPFLERRRLLRLARAYELADRAEELLARQDASAAAALYRQISELAPDADELTFWAGVGVGAQDLDLGTELIERAASRNPSWLELLERLPSELAPAAASLRAAIAARAERAS